MTDDKAAEALLKAEQAVYERLIVKLDKRIAELEAQVASARDDALDEVMLKVKSLGNHYNVSVKINAFMACVLDLIRTLKSTTRENK